MKTAICYYCAKPYDQAHHGQRFCVPCKAEEAREKAKLKPERFAKLTEKRIHKSMYDNDGKRKTHEAT